jgi:hypothetical protein
MTEQQIRATLRLGVQVFLRSERTGRVWIVTHDDNDPTKLRGYPDCRYPTYKETGPLTTKQVGWHLINKPHNFTTTPPCASGSTTTNLSADNATATS